MKLPATIALAALSALVVDAEVETGVRGLQSKSKSAKDAKAKSAKAAKVFKTKSSKDSKSAKMSKGSDASASGAMGDASSAGGMDRMITEEMILEAQQTWGEGIVRINAAYEAGEDYEAVAADHITNLYAYGMNDQPVLFKPTLAAEEQFRSTFEGALSYFVATGHVPEDTGFAIKGWTDVRFENDGIITVGDVGMSMGNYFFTDPNGDEVKVEYSFGYLLDDEGMPRIHLHHSSNPYDPNAPTGDDDASSDDTRTITADQVEAAQEAWGQGIVDINAAYEADGKEAATEVATDHINTLYAYGISPVLFKPTLAAEEQFRGDFDGALSYFVATGHVPEDTGFAIKGWTDVRFENEDIIINDGVAQAMGNYFFTDPNGDEVKVEYSFGYILDEDGNVRINLHHSSNPYDPTVDTRMITEEQVLAAQQAWGEGIVRIAAAYTEDPEGDEYTQEATDHINALYAYDTPPVLFKPTLAAEEQFRGDFDGALSYFVATGHVPEDTGFAIKGWTNVRFENEDIITVGPMGLAMGNYFFTDPEGEEVKVEYSFAYYLDADGEPRIHLHHSSNPYDPNA